MSFLFLPSAKQMFCFSRFFKQGSPRVRNPDDVDGLHLRSAPATTLWYVMPPKDSPSRSSLQTSLYILRWAKGVQRRHCYGRRSSHPC
jgi:hypothetical protein